MKYTFNIEVRESSSGGHGMELSGETDDPLDVDVAYSTLVDGYMGARALFVNIQEDGKEVDIQDIKREIRRLAQEYLDAEMELSHGDR